MKSLVVLLFVLVFVQSELLFKQAFLKFKANGRRVNFLNITQIDNEIVPETAKLLQIRSKSLPVLFTKSIRDIKNVETISMVQCRIERLEGHPFWNLTNLKMIYLKDNFIEEVPQNVFNDMPLEVVGLQRNQIKTIDSHAFDNMPNLRKIQLNSNKLKMWDSNWFKQTPNLIEVFFRRNLLKVLPPNSFKNLQNSSVQIFLSKNKLHRLEKDSFEDLRKVGQLFLDRNQLEEVPKGVFANLEEIDVLYLARNRIEVIEEGAMPKISKMRILDLSNNLLDCLPFELVAVAKMTHLEFNNQTCECVEEFSEKLKVQKLNNEITYDKDDC